jgi:hypothetical protein
MRRVPAAALGGVLIGLLAGCGGGANYGVLSPMSRPAGGASPSPSVSAEPTLAVSPSPGAAASSPPAAMEPAPRPTAPAAARTFPLVAVGDAGARGTVTVRIRSGRAVIEVFAAGLPPGSVHSVHLHFGYCPSAGSHILVLGTLRAGGDGSGALTAAVSPAFAGAGHFVIVYVGPTAGPLGACANLG